MAKKDLKIYSIYNTPDVPGFKCVGPSMTQQQFKEESDINNIVDYNMRYKDPAFITKLQLAGKISMAKPIYGDFAQVKDYQSSLSIIQTAQEQFKMLPAKIRARFGDNPANMLEFVENEANYNECVELGLISKKSDNSDGLPIVPDNVNELRQALQLQQYIENGVATGQSTVSNSVQETSAQSLT